jgi:hypothetical protein
MLNRDRGPQSAARNREVKRWVEELFELGPEAVVMVSELACTEPGCPPRETVIAILRGPGDMAQHKLHLAMAEITRADVERLHGAPETEHEPHES